MNKTFITLLLFTTSFNAQAQSTKAFADSIRVAYKIPELNYAVVSSSKIIELEALGNKKINSALKAELTDRFRIGSNTKTITSYIAWLLVKEGTIKWDTQFFDLYPELKAKCDSAYYKLTLKDFITFRANIPQWSYGNESPTQGEIKGSYPQQRYEFIAWTLQQKPLEKRTFYWSNPSYVAAGLMLEKASGKEYKTLVTELGKALNIQFDFGQPNLKDINQTWGHDDTLTPEAPADSYKLNWLLAAGNINASLPDYVKFIQLQLNGLLGKSKTFTAEEFNTMHYGLPEFAYGWFTEVNDMKQVVGSYHIGNPGTFISEVHLYKDIDKAFIIFANIQSDEAEKALKILLGELNERYGR